MATQTTSGQTGTQQGTKHPGGFNGNQKLRRRAKAGYKRPGRFAGLVDEQSTDEGEGGQTSGESDCEWQDDFTGRHDEGDSPAPTWTGAEVKKPAQSTGATRR